MKYKNNNAVPYQVGRLANQGSAGYESFIYITLVLCGLYIVAIALSEIGKKHKNIKPYEQ